MTAGTWVNDPVRGWILATPVQEEEHYSASQIEAFLLCKRKWAGPYLNGWERGTNRFAAWGLVLHGMIERYLRDGVPFDLTTPQGLSAMAGLHFLPSPATPGMTIENFVPRTGEREPFRVRIGGHLFIGYKDIAIPAWGSVSETGDYTVTTPKVFDHKSCGDFAWMKTAETLRTSDVQAAIYTYEALSQYTTSQGIDAVDLTWIYYRRDPPAARRSSARVTMNDIAPTIAGIVRAADEMSALRKAGVKALDLAPNPDACGAFGGCHYRDRCNLTPREKLRAKMTMQPPGGPVDDFMSKLRARQALDNVGLPQNGAPPGAPPWAAPASAPPTGTAPPAWNPGAAPQAPAWAPPAQAALPAPGGVPAYQGPAPGATPQWAPPPAVQTAPPAWAPPAQAPITTVPPAPQYAPEIVAYARTAPAGPPTWEPGQPWYSGNAAQGANGWIQPGEPQYPPAMTPAPQGSAPMPPLANPPAGAAPNKRGRKPKDAQGQTDQDPHDLAAMSLEGFGKACVAFCNGIAQAIRNLAGD